MWCISSCAQAAATGGGVTAEAAAAAVSSPTTPCPATPRTRPAQQLASRRRSPPPPSRRKGSRTRLSEQPFSPADFSRLRQVGRGGFGVVYLVVKRDEPNKGAPFRLTLWRLLFLSSRERERADRRRHHSPWKTTRSFAMKVLEKGTLLKAGARAAPARRISVFFFFFRILDRVFERVALASGVGT